MKRILTVLSSVALLIGCSFDILGTPSDSSYLKKKGGGFVYDCQGGVLFKDFAENYWDYHKLPRGTTEFVCVNGKPYLLGKEPKQ